MKQSHDRAYLHPLILLRKRKDKKKVIFQRYIALFFGRKNLFGPPSWSKRFHNTFIYSVKFISLLKPLIATTKNYLKYENFISYEDPDSISYKCDFIREKGLAGLMYWAYGSHDLFEAVVANLD